MSDKQPVKLQPAAGHATGRGVGTRSVLIAGLMLAVAGTLIVLSAPRLVASLLQAPAFATQLAAQRGEPLDSAQLAAAIGQVEQALTWSRNPKTYNDLGYLYLLQATQSEKGQSLEPLDQRTLDKAVRALRQSLLLAPAQPHAWLRLAVASQLRHGPSRQAADYLDRSLWSGAWVSDIALPRLEALLANWPYLSARGRQAVGQQIRFVWRVDPQGLIALAKRSQREGLILAALSPLPEAQAEVSRRLSPS